MNLLILGAYGRIARLVEERLLKESAFETVNVTLYLRHKERLAHLAANPRVTLINGDIDDKAALTRAMADIDLVFLATVDSQAGNQLTKTVVNAMHTAGVSRLVASSSVGIYHEDPNPAFDRWNHATIGPSLAGMRGAADYLKETDLDYTVARYAWLNDRDQVDYVVTPLGEPFAGGSGSRKSMADVILKIVADPTRYSRAVIGISDPATKEAGSVVY